jgi:hypothetical protein
MKQAALSLGILFVTSTNVFAGIDGIYKAESTSGVCASVILTGILEVFEGKPSKLKFPTATMSFDNSATIEKKEKGMVLNDSGKLTKVFFRQNSNGTISFSIRDQDDECNGSSVVFSKSN